MNWFDWVVDSIKNARFLAVLGVGFLVVMILRLPSPPLRLPKEAHNTVGDIPIFEQADDGYVSSIGEKPPQVVTPYVSADMATVPIYEQRRRSRRATSAVSRSFVDYSGLVYSRDVGYF